ncbi:tripartite tricarboxylate transporter substrate binding protein [Achromobacter aloeverae]|uniref:MFS transporter n=1 Tax=Achromobacter aloeverae TaxID=1750518 RepID=A0A4Q1HPF4_9BURK|nr:tripartite tricarboxylate transporter substrate binding protein [Achromobacter aloeverae]RXN92707.1 MFS transporter [Achromobacter aloeverae]
MRLCFAGAVVRAVRSWAVLLACGVLPAVPVHAQGPVQAGPYPSAPIRLIVPFAPGGFTDVVARLLGDKLGAALGQPVVVENRVGAGSTIGTDYVAKAPADGYTLVLISTTHVIAPWLYKTLPYDPIKSFAPVAKLVDSPYVLVTNPQKVPAASVGELIALAKSRPGRLDYASSGNGSSQHLAAALFASMADLQLMHVPYRGSGQALADIMGGQVSMGFLGVTAALPQIRAGRLRALAVTTMQRSPDLPDVPTLDEAGLKGYEATIWLGLLAPAGTPPEVVRRLHDTTDQVMRTEDARKALATAGLTLSLGSSAEFGQLLESESAKWGKVVKQTGATVN